MNKHLLRFRSVQIAILLFTLCLLVPTTTSSAASKALEIARQLNEAFVEVSESAARSVVVIEVTYRIEAPTSGLEGNPWLERLPEWFRRELFPDAEDGGESDGSESPSPHRRRPQDSESEGRGSGVIIREEGFILTNAHVVKDASEIKVRLKDGREFEAEVRGVDELSEVAVLKLKGEKIKELPVAKFADSDKVRVGEFAIAIGAPFALDYSVTVGHVSAKGRANVVPAYMNGQNMDQNFIQTDASINPGNSGGPLINLDGEVIGINTMIRGIGTGIGFAVPSNLARMVSDQLIEKGTFERAWLGVAVVELSRHESRELLAPGVKHGLVVSSIPKGAPAANSDLKPSDVITAVNGKAIRDVLDLREAVRSYPLGTTLSLDVVRGGKEMKIDVATGAMSQDALARASIPRSILPEPETIPLGITVKEIDDDLVKKFGLKNSKGVVITRVAPDSTAAERGIRPGMIVTDLNHKPVQSLEDYQSQIEKVDLEKGVLVNFLDAEGNNRFEVLRDE